MKNYQKLERRRINSAKKGQQYKKGKTNDTSVNKEKNNESRNNYKI